MSLKLLSFSKSPQKNPAMPIQWLKTLTFVFFLLSSSIGNAHSQPYTSTIGSVDSLEYDYADQQLRINGWVWDSVTARSAERLQITIDKEKYHINALIQTERPDVKAAHGISLLRTGFSAVVPLRHALPVGKQTVEITAILADGRPFQMQSGQHGAPEVQVQQLLGFIDSVSYEISGHQLKIDGWTWNTFAKQPAIKLNLSMQGENYEIPLFNKVVRKDVQDALHLPIPTVGFSTKVALRSPLPSGSHTFALTALFEDERSLQLPSQHGSLAMVHIVHTPSRHWILMTIAIMGIALGYFTRLHLYTARAGAWIQHYPNHISMVMGFSFALLVTFGITGSSWLLLSQGSWGDMLDFAGSSKHLFKLRDIRSDEWSVLTPNVLSQWNHHPPFPVINTHLGLEGQNMGVIGMTGVPIAQPAALGRLATWGYFFLPLRQAMSWHWLFPFFGCLFFLWKTLNLFLPERKAFNLLLSFTFCVSPYAAGWSLWPLYATLFPLAIFVVGTHILQTNNLTRALLLGVGMGILISGWVLVLYPPWQVTTGTLLAVVALGWAIDQRAYLRWNKVQWLSLGLALFIAAVLLISWWLDTVDAVAKLRATVYPGGRTAMQGADIVGAPWWALRGYLNPEVLHSGLGPGAHEPTLPVVANQSEISSYIFLPLPVLILGLWHSIKTSSHPWTLRACLAFIAFTLVFYFFGIPLWLSNTIFWSHVTSARLDLAAALACTFVLALVRGHGTIQYKSHWALVFYFGTALASAGLAFAEFQRLPKDLLKANSLTLQLSIALIVGWSAWWLMRRRLAAAVSLILLLNFISTLKFNPISQAPQDVRLSGLNADAAFSNGQHFRTLVISEGAAPSMMLAAAGVSTVGGVFYYPHKKLWESLGITPQEWPIVNRYQHLSFKLAPVTAARPFQVSNSQGDTVIVALDPQRFRFSDTGAKRVVAQEKDAALLRSNASLVEIGNQGGLFWFAVHPRESENKIPNS